MNLAATILCDVSAAGGMITVQDGRLKLSAPKPLPKALLDRVREAKPILLAALRLSTSWDAADWQVFYDERAGIAEHDGWALRPDAERMAYKACIADWQNKNPPTHSDLATCPECCKALDRNTLAVLTGNGGHIWLHDRCHAPWLARRRQEAIAALSAKRIKS